MIARRSTPDSGVGFYRVPTLDGLGYLKWGIAESIAVGSDYARPNHHSCLDISSQRWSIEIRYCMLGRPYMAPRECNVVGTCKKLDRYPLEHMRR